MRTEETSPQASSPAPRSGRRQPSAGPGAWPPLAWAALALVIGLAITAVLGQREREAARLRADTLHASLADAAQARLREPLDAASIALRAMQTVFLSNDVMDQADFARYQTNLRAVNTVPGYRITGFARYRPASAGQPASYQDYTGTNSIVRGGTFVESVSFSTNGNIFNIDLTLAVSSRGKTYSQPQRIRVYLLNE